MIAEFRWLCENDFGNVPGPDFGKVPGPEAPSTNLGLFWCMVSFVAHFSQGAGAHFCCIPLIPFKTGSDSDRFEGDFRIPQRSAGL
jgi:hypothetical protein